MPSTPETSFHQAPFRWFLKAVLVGFLASAPITLLMNGFQGPAALRSGLVGVIFSLIMWSGFEWGSPWLGRIYRRSLALAQAAWLLFYSALFLLSAGAVRLLLGINLLRSPVAALVSFLIGFAISSAIVGYHSARQLVEAERALEQTRGEARIQALKARLSPHTLFNALNTIAALIPGDPGGAEASVESLSRFLRRTLEALERDTWTLAEEFELITCLLELEQARFGARLTWRLELPEAEATRTVPPLLILPLVENSLKHGFRPKVGPCALTVIAGPGGVRVEDDGVGLGARAGTGVGLEAVESRLRAVGGSLSWPEAAQGCIVEVRLCP